VNFIDYFFEIKVKNNYFHPRKIELPQYGSFLLFGARGVGKSSLIIDYINLKKEKYLYIDAEDPNILHLKIYILRELGRIYLKRNSIKLFGL